jgi:hypothetical protein
VRGVFEVGRARCAPDFVVCRRINLGERYTVSLPHTGKLNARIDGGEYRFDGAAWDGPDPDLVSSLNKITARAPKQHFNVRELAGYVLCSASVAGEILTWEADQWKEELPPGAVD